MKNRPTGTLKITASRASSLTVHGAGFSWAKRYVSRERCIPISFAIRR